MINKKNLWFLTLFSLVLVLSIYYITMPNELLQSVSKEVSSKDNEEVSIEQNNIIETMKTESTEEVNAKISELQEKLTDLTISTEEKNKVYEEIKAINENSGKAEKIDAKIKEQYKCDSFSKIENSDVKVVLDNCEGSKSLANNIMRLVQEEFDNKMYISVQFE